MESPFGLCTSKRIGLAIYMFYLFYIYRFLSILIIFYFYFFELLYFSSIFLFLELFGLLPCTPLPSWFNWLRLLFEFGLPPVIFDFTLIKSLFYFLDENIFCLWMYPAEYLVVIGIAYGYFEITMRGMSIPFRVLGVLVILGQY